MATLTANPHHIEFDKPKHSRVDESGVAVPGECDANTESETDAELSDIPSNSDNETDEDPAENLLDSDEVRYKLKKLAGHGGTYIRRKSVGTIIPNWPALNVEAFKRGKAVTTSILFFHPVVFHLFISN